MLWYISFAIYTLYYILYTRYDDFFDALTRFSGDENLKIKFLFRKNTNNFQYYTERTF